ncbi:hypothetical protein MKEN_00864200 [Mycena kentingensis (nom. inval.)]|nr:hypothetical protein MKEN_00864200 [Mycena kentingensis (nom. inval.)]
MSLEPKTSPIPRTPLDNGLEVLCLGFPRTGTSSLRKGLEILGYKFSPTADALTQMRMTRKEREMWNRAIEAKIYGRGRKFGKEEWDELLGVNEGVTAVISDLPHLIFTADLIAAYPNAKIILTTREPRKWFKSYSTTLATLLLPVSRFTLPWNRRAAFFERRVKIKVLRAVFGHPQPTPEQAKKRFGKHYEDVRKMLPKIKAPRREEGAEGETEREKPEQRRLEYKVGEGWERLCTFLGKEVPQEEFPKSEAWRERQPTSIAAGIIQLVARAEDPWRRRVKYFVPIAMAFACGVAIYNSRVRVLLN